jgi:hypothetical protein
MKYVSFLSPAVRLGSILLVALTLAPNPAQAQKPNDKATREKISEALSKGDLATAQKLLAPSAKAVAEPSPFYEEIKACGFYPQETRIECVIEIKQPFGYGGPIGSFGSFEFVQMCVDWNNDGVFTALESVGQGIVQVHDDPFNPPWEYAVYRDINPPGGFRTSNTGATTTTTTNGPTLRARAVLSWLVAPSDCNFIPIWGNIVNFNIRLDPIR